MKSVSQKEEKLSPRAFILALCYSKSGGENASVSIKDHDKKNDTAILGFDVAGIKDDHLGGVVESVDTH